MDFDTWQYVTTNFSILLLLFILLFSSFNQLAQTWKHISCWNLWVHAFYITGQLRYHSIITSHLHASPRMSPRVVRVESAKSYRGKLHFHVTGCGFSMRRLVAFHDTWHFHETTRGISTKRVVEFPRDQLPWNLAWNFHETSSRGT